MTNHSTSTKAAAAPHTKDEPKHPPAKKKGSDPKTNKSDAPKAPRPGRGVAPGITGN